MSPLLADFYAQVTQMVEHSIENAGVGCSIQPLGTIPLFSYPVMFKID